MDLIVSLLVLILYFGPILFVIVDAPHNANHVLPWVVVVVLFSLLGFAVYLVFGRQWPEVETRTRKGNDRRPWEE